ncbi:hypothetical protein L7F22_058969 [Adiantum nelumboides]|nr:hypothetical protein [Adiantum nelumboides]
MPISEELWAMVMVVLGMVVSIVNLLILQKQSCQLEHAKLLNNPFTAKLRTSSKSSRFLLAYLNVCYGIKLSQLAQEFCSISEFYVKPRSLDWWNHYVSALQGDDQCFKEIFRLPVSIFQQLSQLLREHLQQGAIPELLARVIWQILLVEKHVAIALLRLASGSRLIDIGEHFGVGKATVSKIIKKFVDALLEFCAHFIFWPRDLMHLEEVKRGFLLQRGLPNCCGALDETHINMEKP